MVINTLNSSRAFSVFLAPDGKNSNGSPNPLPPLVDYHKVARHKLLFVPWVSMSGYLTTHQYRKDCSDLSIQINPLQLVHDSGGSIIRLRETILVGGLRYVGLYHPRPNDDLIIDDFTYRGEAYHVVEMRPGSSLNQSDFIRNVDLEDGFTGHSFRNGSKTSVVEKKFSVNGASVHLSYELTPPIHETEGNLRFGYSQALQNQTIRIHLSQDSFMITLDHNRGTDACSWNPVTFRFDKNGYIESISGSTRGGDFMPKRQGHTLISQIGWKAPQFNYSASNREAKQISHAVFGLDITELRHNARNTLEHLLKAAIRETEIDLRHVVEFSP